MLIEDAIESFLQDAAAVLSEEGISLDITDNSDFDTVVFPAQTGQDFETAFFNDREWRFVRVDKTEIPKIRYIALYLGAPESCIRWYSEVDSFHYEQSKGKYRIRLKGDPLKLPTPILLGNASPLSTRSPKYTTLQKLLTVNEFRELYT